MSGKYGSTLYVGLIRVDTLITDDSLDDDWLIIFLLDADWLK